MKHYFLVGILKLLSASALAQDTLKINPLSISGYAEVYYLYDLNKPVNGNCPAFIYSHNRHNEFNLNLGYLKAAYKTEKVRANISFASGTYMNANYAAEPGVLKNIFEANVGFKLCGNKNLWVDVGILPSHIGFESAVSKDCPNLTRSILAENTPYFEAGAKITYTTGNGKWLFSTLALNGWQHITRLPGNSLMSWGTQLQFKPSGKVLMNYSTFIGSDKPDSVRSLRWFHNIYALLTIRDKTALILGIDIGTEESRLPVRGNNTWYSPIGILQYRLTNNWSVAGRVEYYHDRAGVIIPTGTLHGFQTIGYSLNIDYAPEKNLLLRIEGRNINSRDPIFPVANALSRNNMFVTSSIAVNF